MNISRESIVAGCRTVFMINMAQMDAIFEHPTVKAAYERFEQKGYRKKLRALTKLNMLNSNQYAPEEEDVIRIHIVQEATGRLLFTEVGNGDVRVAICALLEAEWWLADIDERYEAWRKSRRHLN